MRWADIPFKPSRATLRWFGVVGALLLAGLAGRQYFGRDDPLSAVVLLGAALLVSVVAVVVPWVLRPIFVGWMVLAYPINWITSHLILAFVYYCIFTPLGLCFKLFGRDRLGLRNREKRNTYWTVKPGTEDVRSYFRQS